MSYEGRLKKVTFLYYYFDKSAYLRHPLKKCRDSGKSFTTVFLIKKQEDH